ncbi:Rab family GTPase [Teredinibacter haidensis]|uniref:Rab family GTPase n=1 Tax=Teredinibacter haidensis TaxID=2731755 RepID=UPI000948D0DC|nr:Rab family GTPase [Teredinibacter haidensis]
MIQKKICLIGAFAVGKTSLVKQFVESIFDERYLTTVGVKVDKKQLVCKGEDVTLMIWDLAGEDEFCKLKTSYLRGASGYILVVDPTRPKTLERALRLQKCSAEVLDNVPYVIALNKADLKQDWLLSDEDFQNLGALHSPVLHTSAKTGEEVEALFLSLAEQMIS